MREGRTVAKLGAAREPSAAERAQVSENCDVCGASENLERKLLESVIVVLCQDPKSCLGRWKSA